MPIIFNSNIYIPIIQTVVQRPTKITVGSRTKHKQQSWRRLNKARSYENLTLRMLRDKHFQKLTLQYIFSQITNLVISNQFGHKSH